MLRALRRTVLGSGRDLYDPRIFQRITIGAFAAWIAMGGDLLGSCIYGPDVLGRGAGGDRLVLLGAGLATIATLALLAWAYVRMVAQFPHGGGGYTAARETGHRRLALVSGVALLFDAPLNVAVSVVACVNAAGDALGGAMDAAKLPLALALIALLLVLNLRGVKESVAFLVPIVLVFVVSHLAVLGVGFAHAAGFAEAGAAHPAAAAAARGAGEGGMLGTFGTVGAIIRAYALGGAIYTGLEVISNGVPILRDPKVPTARRTMLLLAGVPALVIAAIVGGYLVFGVAPDGATTLNALMFGRIADAVGADSGWPRGLMVTLPLLSEAALLIVAAQSGFVDGPRILSAMAADRHMPRRFVRLNARLAPGPAILLISGIAFAATLIVGGHIGPLLALFVVSVFVTFTISQWVLLRHACARAAGDAWRRRRDVALFATTLVLCLIILGGTVVAWPIGSLATFALIAAVVGLSVAIRRRYDALPAAVERSREQAIATIAASVEPVPVADPLPGQGIAVAVVLVGERPQLASVAVRWLATVPVGVGGVILASVALLDADAIQGEEQLREAEARRGEALEAIAREARDAGLPAWTALRRGADLVEAATELIAGLMRDRPRPSIVIGFRAALHTSAVDALLRDDLAVTIQARLERERIPMIVVSFPLDA